MTALQTPRTETSQDCYAADKLLCGNEAKLRESARQFVRQEISYVPNRSFQAHHPDVDSNDAALRWREVDTSEQATPTGDLAALRGLPAHLARLCEFGLLTAEEERNLFRRMNLLKFRANQYRSRIDPEHPNRAGMERAKIFLDQAQAIRDHLTKSNMRLVMSIARKFVTPQNSFDDLLSDGVMSLLHAVEKFDYDRGFRFSTYAYRSISRSLYRTVNKRRKEIAQLGRVDARVADFVEDRSRSEITDYQEQRQRELLTRCVNQLDRRERFILRSRFALGAHRKKRTCRELGERLGISKERVRQIEIRAVSKIEEMVAGEQGVEAIDRKTVRS